MWFSSKKMSWLSFHAPGKTSHIMLKMVTQHICSDYLGGQYRVFKTTLKPGKPWMLLILIQGRDNAWNFIPSE